MAKSNARTERIAFDDYDFDQFGDFDLGGFEDAAPVRNDRNPVAEVAGSFIKGSAEALQNQDFQRNIIKHALPKGYLRTYDAARDANSVLQDIRYEARTGLDNLVDTTKRTIQPLTNKLDRVLPKEMAGKVKDWSKSTRNSNSYGRYDPQQYQRAEMQDTMNDIFGGWEAIKNDINRDRTNQTMTTDAATELYNDDVNQKLHSGTNEELGRIRVIMERGQEYNNKVSHRFREKSLEVAYKTMWSVSTIADLTKQNMEQQKAANDRLVKNTALPEIVKMHNSELAWQLMKERSFGGIVDSVGSSFDSMRRRLIEKTRKEVNGFFREAVGTVSTLGAFTQSMGHEDMDDYDPNETEEERRRRKQREELTGAASSAAEWGGSQMARKYGRKVGEWVKEKWGDHPEVERVGLALSNFLDSAPSYMNDALDRRKKSGSETFDYIRNLLGLDTLKYKEENSIRKSSLADLDQMAMFNVRTQRTINEIIPGWLGRIHNEIRMHRTGTDNLDPLRWSFESNSFEDTSKSLQRLKNKLFNRNIMAGTSNDLDIVMQEIDPDSKLSPASRKHLRNYLIQSVYSPDKRITLESLMAYGSTLDDTAKAEIGNLRAELTDKDLSFFESSVLGGIRSDFGGNREEQARRARILAAMQNARDGIPTNVHDIIKRAKSGDMDILARSGLLQQTESGEWVYSNDALKDELGKYSDMVGPRSPYRRGFKSGGSVNNLLNDDPKDNMFVKKAKSYLRQMSPGQLQAIYQFLTMHDSVADPRKSWESFSKKVPPGFALLLKHNKKSISKYILPIIQSCMSAADGINTVNTSTTDIPGINLGGTGGPTRSSKNDNEIGGVTHANEFVIRSISAMQPGARDFLNRFNSVGMSAIDQFKDRAKDGFRQAKSGIEVATGTEGAIPLMERTNDLLRGVQVAVSDMALNGVSIDPNPDKQARKRRFTKALVKKHFNAKDILSPTFIIGTVATGGTYALADLGWRTYGFAKDYGTREALDRSSIGINALEQLTAGMEATNPRMRQLLLRGAKGAANIARNRQDIHETISERQGEFVDKILDRLESRAAARRGDARTNDTENTVDKDGDGLRDNSWQEAAARARAGENMVGPPRPVDVPAPTDNKPGGVFGLLTSLVGMVGMFIPSALTWGSRILSWGGAIKDLLKTIALGRAAGGIAGGVGDFLGGRGRGTAGRLGRFARRIPRVGKVLGLASLAAGGYMAADMAQPAETETANIGYGIKREFDIPPEEQEQSWGDKAMEWGGHGLTAWSVASLANMATGGALYTGIGAAATAVAGFLTAPVLIGAAVVGAVAVGGYLLYKKLKSDSSYCLNFRMAQYGFSYKNSDAVSNVLEMESYLLKHVTVSKGRPAAIGKGANLPDLMKIFKIDPKDKDATARFINWVAKRFKPIFLGAVTTYFNIINSKDLMNADSGLSAEQKIQYINGSDIASGGAETPYNEMASPMPKAQALQMDATAIGNYKTIAINKLEKSTTKDKSKDVETKSLKTEKEQALAKDGTAGGESWQDQTKAKADERREGFREAMGNAWQGFKDMNRAMYDTLVPDAVKNVISGIGDTISETWDNVRSLSGTRKEKYNQIRAAAVAAGDMHPDIVAAQWALESGWGKKESGKNNFFGIKAKKGESATEVHTHEVINGRRVPIIDRFKNYASLNEGIADRVGFIKRNPRYTKAGYFQATTPFQAAQALQRGGYATDPKYAKSLAEIIKGAGYDPGATSIANTAKAGTSAAATAAGAAGKGGGLGGGTGIPYANAGGSGGSGGAGANPLARGSISVPAGGFAAVAGPSAGVPAAKTVTNTGSGQATPANVQGGYTTTSSAAVVATARALDPNLVEYGKKMAVREDNGVDLVRMNQEFMRYVYCLIGEWSKANGGRKVMITSAFRSREKQYALWYKYKYQGGNLAAYPGKSKHEFGIAIDIDKHVANSMSNQGLLRKYGFTRPLLNHRSHPEPWHLEHNLFGKPGATQKAVQQAQQAAPKPSDAKKLQSSEKAIKAAPKANDSAGVPVAKPMVSGNTKSPIGTGKNGQPTPAPVPQASDMAVGNTPPPIASTGTTGPTPRYNGDRNTVSPNADAMARQQLDVMNSMNVNLVKIVDSLGRIERGGGLSKASAPQEDSNATAAKIAQTVAQTINGTLDKRSKATDLRPPVNLKS